MPPSWLPMCRAMQVYCEPYFYALDNWTKSKEEAILFNRLKVIETIGDLFQTLSQNPVNHYFEIVCENPAIELLPEVMPSAGKDYKPEGDQIVYKAVMGKFPKDFFQRAGIFFQENLLKGIAGFSEEKLAQSNLETRNSLIAAVEKLFRIPEEAGDVHIYCTKEASSKRDTVEVQLLDFSAKGSAFYHYILGMRQDGLGEPVSEASSRRGAKAANGAAGKADTAPATQKKNKKRTRGGDHSDNEAEFQADQDGVVWTRRHKSVGTQVAAHFPPLEPTVDLVPKHDQPSDAAQLTSTVGKIFRGKVVRYAPPSAPGVNDQLYHVRWEDGDEQDFDEMDMIRAMDLFDSLEGWTTRHHSIGTRVAAYFEVPIASGPRKGQLEQRRFVGEVTKYGMPMSPEDIALYHVVFDDGDEQDFNDAELQLGVELYKKGAAEAASAGSGSGKATVSNKKARASTGTSSAAVVAKEAPATAAKADRRGRAAKASPARKAAAEVVVIDDEVEWLETPAPKESASGRPLRPSKVVVEAEEAAASRAERRAKDQVKAEKAVSKAGSISSTAGSATKSAKKATKGGKGKKTGGKVKNEEEGDSDEDPVWTIHHDSVGKRVVQYFQLPGTEGKNAQYEPYGGTVAVYAPPSKPTKSDQLYHVVWDDGDEQDYDEREFKQALRVLDSLMPTPLAYPSEPAKVLVAAGQKKLAADYGKDAPAAQKQRRQSSSSHGSSNGERSAEQAGEGSGTANSSPSADAAVTEVDLTQDDDGEQPAAGAEEEAGAVASEAGDDAVPVADDRDGARGETPNDDFLSVRTTEMEADVDGADGVVA